MTLMVAEIEPAKEEKNLFRGYEELQKVLDKVVGRIGLRSTIALLTGCIEEHKEHKDETAKRQALPSFVLSKVMEIYGADEKTIYQGTTRECTDARKICYHLCSKYTGHSRSKIGLLFGGASKRKVQDCITKTDEILSVPKFHKVFCSNYEIAEKAVIDFLTK